MKPTIKDVVEIGGNLPLSDFQLNSPQVMTLLRKKIYSHPMRTCIQEVMCNARDANREVKKWHEPIRVSLKEGELRIRDKGVGINSDRLKYYTSYGESTKQRTNSQTGGYGLGCKSPFAIADSFLVETCFDEGGYRWEAIYQFIISNSGTSQYTILSKERVTDSRGTYTEVVIPVAREDYSSACSAILRTCQYWGLKVVKTSAYPILDIPYLDTSFPKIEDTELIVNRLLWTAKDLTVVVDGILYDELSPKFLTNFHKYAKCRLFFNTGEVDISPTRETLDYSTKTELAIMEAFEHAWGQVRQEITDHLSSLSDGDELERHMATLQWVSKRNNPIYSAVYAREFPSILDAELSTVFNNQTIFQPKMYMDGKIEIPLPPSHVKSSHSAYSIKRDNILVVVRDTKDVTRRLRRAISSHSGTVLLVQHNQHVDTTYNVNYVTSEVDCIIDRIHKLTPWKFLDKFRKLSEFEPMNPPKKPRPAVPPSYIARRLVRGVTQTRDIRKPSRKRLTYVVKYFNKLYDDHPNKEGRRIDHLVDYIKVKHYWVVETKSLDKCAPCWVSAKKWADDRKLKQQERAEKKPEAFLSSTSFGMKLQSISKSGFLFPPGHPLAAIASSIVADILPTEHPHFQTVITLGEQLADRYPLFTCVTSNRGKRHLYAYLKTTV